MNWTKEPPREEGFWWYRQNKWTEIFYLMYYDNEWVAMTEGEIHESGSRQGKGARPADDMTGEWQKVPEPKE